MKLLLAILRYEFLLQLRSVRFRLAVLGYLALTALPPCLVFFVVRHRSTEALGSSAYLAPLLQIQPYLTVLLVLLIAGNRSGAGALGESWSVLAASPMSNAGYLLRRWVALLTLLVPLSLVPQVLALGAAVAAGQTHFESTAWIGGWLLQVLPIVIGLTGYWLAWVTIAGSELAALILTMFALPLVVSVANQILLKFHLTLQGYQQGLSYRSFSIWAYYTFGELFGTLDERFRPGYAATEGPYDLTSAAAQSLPSWALIGGLGALGFGLAVAFLRRTRRDLSPRPVPPTHQLRTFLEKLNRWRERYAPDGGLGLPERLAAAAGAAVLGLALIGLLGRQLDFKRLAAERYRAETKAEWDPLPAEVRPTLWKLRGSIDPQGHLEVDWTGRIENRGPAELSALSFSLNPKLTIGRLEVLSREVETLRAWDRLQVRLDPALAVGEEIELRVSLAGVPASVEFNFGRWRSRQPLPMQYEGLLHARFPRDVPNLATSQIRRAASPRRVMLRASDLGLVPRYTSWALTQPGESRGAGYESSDFGREVLVEVDPIVTDVEVDLEVPPGTFLADTCGHVTRTFDHANASSPASIPQAETPRAKLAGSCQTSLNEFQVAGGRLVRMPLTPANASSRPAEDANGADSTKPEVVVAVLPQHREQAQRSLSSLELVASLSDRAWPGMPGLQGLVALEWPPTFHLDLRRGVRRWDWQEPELLGRLLLIPEGLLIHAEPFEPEDLVARLLGRDLLDRRQLAADQEWVFQQLFRSLMVRRMGLAGEQGATVSGKPWVRQALATPILLAKPGQYIVWNQRLPAVLAEIEGRVGSDLLYVGIESFLAVDSGEPGTIEGLLAAIEARTGVSLERTYEDHFQGGSLPMLRLEEVFSRPQRRGWEVTGKVRNTGTGQSICPVIVKTELSEQVLTVTVDSESATEFSLRTERRPHTVLLDPNRTCYRFLLKTSPALERANLLG